MGKNVMHFTIPFTTAVDSSTQIWQWVTLSATIYIGDIAVKLKITEYCVQFWIPCFKKSVNKPEKLEKTMRISTKNVNNKRLYEQGLFSLKENGAQWTV